MAITAIDLTSNGGLVPFGTLAAFALVGFSETASS